MLLVLLLLAQLAPLSSPGPCERLEASYENAEGMLLDGLDASSHVPELFALADECALQGGTRNALESYFFGLSILRPEVGSLSASACEPLATALHLVEQLITENPKNLRFRELQMQLDSMEGQAPCSVEEPLQKIVEAPKTISKVPKSLPEDQTHSEVSPRLKDAAISMGVLSGAALVTGVVLWGVGRTKAQEASARLSPVLEEQTANACPFFPSDSLKNECREVIRLRLGVIISWSVVGLAANTALILGLTHRARKVASSRRSSLQPHVEFGRGWATLGATIRF